jgi:hypothetical protein
VYVARINENLIIHENDKKKNTTAHDFEAIAHCPVIGCAVHMTAPAFLLCCGLFSLSLALLKPSLGVRR